MITSVTEDAHIKLWGRAIRLAILDLRDACISGAQGGLTSEERMRVLKRGSSAAWFLFGDNVGISQMLFPDVVGYIRLMTKNIFLNRAKTYQPEDNSLFGDSALMECDLRAKGSPKIDEALALKSYRVLLFVIDEIRSVEKCQALRN